MKNTSRSMDVLKKILQNTPENPSEKPQHEKLVETYLQPGPAETKIFQKRPGRPLVEEHLKAKNFTLCLASKYLTFLDQMKMKDKKIQGRGRKIRFIIDQFVEMHRRQKLQVQVISQGLNAVEEILKGFSGQVKKGQKLALSPKEKAQITQATHQVKLLMNVLKYNPKDLHKMLPKSDWQVLSFCLDWSKQKDPV